MSVRIWDLKSVCLLCAPKTHFVANHLTPELPFALPSVDCESVRPLKHSNKQAKWLLPHSSPSAVCLDDDSLLRGLPQSALCLANGFSP